jgi:hypothetical protein
MRDAAYEVFTVPMDEPASLWALDPLGDDRGGSLTVDRVGIVRVVCVAAETGARMQRDGLSTDPMDWMLSPLALFGGRPPIEACMELPHCNQAILLHGLGLDLDIDPRAFCRLMNGSPDGAQHD